MREIVETNGERETWELGKRLGLDASAGQVFTLVGDLGVGKTVFTKGLAEGLGIIEPVAALPLPLFRCMMRGGFRFIILMCTALEMWRRWKRSDMRTMCMGRGVPDRVGGFDQGDPAGALYGSPDRKGSGAWV